MATMRGTAGGVRAAEAELRRAVADTALAMSRSGLSPGRTGNVSARLGTGMLITPSGKVYGELSPADVVHVEGDGSVAPGQRTPSSEWSMPLAVYRVHPEAHAVVHTHSTHATVLACAGKSIPPFHYMVLAAGGRDIPLVPYETFGTEALANVVAEGLKDRRACLMANHGQIACGPTLAAALELAHEVECLAEQYCKVLMLGEPKLLTERQIADAAERFKTYGQTARK